MTIGVLDIFGFENFEMNSFEQVKGREQRDINHEVFPSL